jgi:alkylhydroperoxidase family enzyme
MFLKEIVDATPQADGQSDLRRLFAFRPDVTRHLLQFTQAVMRDSGPLAPGECELLAALTSTSNQCLF